MLPLCELTPRTSCLPVPLSATVAMASLAFHACDRSDDLAPWRLLQCAGPEHSHSATCCALLGLQCCNSATSWCAGALEAARLEHERLHVVGKRLQDSHKNAYKSNNLVRVRAGCSAGAAHRDGARARGGGVEPVQRQ